MKLRKLAPLAIALALFGAACGSDDDGAAVRNIGEEGSGSASGSPSGSASGSASASASASAPAEGSASASGSGSEAAAGDCNVVGGVEAAGDVTVTHSVLDEYSISADPAEVPAGLVTFEAENVGEEPHELAVVKASDVEDLPELEDGSVDLEAIGEDLIGEIEAFDAGRRCEGTFELEAGDYVLLCNLVEDHGAHVAEGMHTTFTVTG